MTRHSINIPLLLKKIRRVSGMTQEGLARKIGITYSTVNSWENGKRLPQPFLLNALLELEKKLPKKSVRK